MRLQATARTDWSDRSDADDDWLVTVARHAAVPWLIAAAFAILGLIAVRRDAFLNDEGVLTWILAGLLSESPVDMLFFLKARPPISALYAPVAAIGFYPFLYVHVLFAAVAIPLTASLARRFGHKNPNLAAALLALSPLYFASAVGGVQNSDATVGLLAIAWLLARDRSMAAGLITGAVTVGRIETAVFAAAFTVYAARTPHRLRFLFGMAVVPVALTVCGAFYHRHLLWPLMYPPSLQANAAVDPVDTLGYGGSLDDFVTTMLALTPLVAAAVSIRVRGRSALENTLTLGAVAFVFILRVLPFTYLVNVDATPRYVLPAVPFLCLAVSGAIEQWRGPLRATVMRLLLFIGLAAAAIAFLEPSAMHLLLAALAACAVAVVLAYWSTRAALATVLATAVLGAVLVLPSTRLLLGDQAGVLDDIVGWLKASNVPRDGVVVTDYSLLGIWLSRHAPDVTVQLRFLWPPDMLYEVATLTNPETAQFDEISHSSRFFYARWLQLEEIPSLPDHSYFVLRRENSRRKDLTQPPLNRVEWVVDGRWRGGTLRQTSGAAAANAAPR